MVLFLKLVGGTQNSQEKVVSNLYWKHSGKLHQHSLKNPNGVSGAGTLVQFTAKRQSLLLHSSPDFYYDFKQLLNAQSALERCGIKSE